MKNAIVGLIAGAVAGAVVVIAAPMLMSTEKTGDELRAEFYEVETASHVSPHGLRKHIADEEFIIVDLRSQEEYETEHIVGAINVPAYATPDKSDYGAVERIVGEFKKIDAQAKAESKKVVVYCYSAGCMTGRKIGHMLAEHEIYPMHLGIGWQEWRYYWNLWNHSGETKVNPSDYVSSGPEPGVFVGDGGEGCPIGGAFGC